MFIELWLRGPLYEGSRSQSSMFIELCSQVTLNAEAERAPAGLQLSPTFSSAPALRARERMRAMRMPPS